MSLGTHSGRVQLTASRAGALGRLAPVDRFWLAVTVTMLLLVGAVVLDLIAPPDTSIEVGEVAGGSLVVTHVRFGSAAWAAGVRVHDPATVVAPAGLGAADVARAGGGGWTELRLAAATGPVLVPARLAPGPAGIVLLAALALGAAVVARGLRASLGGADTLAWLLLIGGGWLLVVGAQLAVRLPAPDTVAATLLVVPPAIGAAFATDRGRAGGRSTAPAATLLVVTLTVAPLVLRGQPGDPWPLLLALETLGVMAFVVAGTAGGARPAMARVRLHVGSGLRGALLDEILRAPARRRSDAVTEERRRLAADLHADVLPTIADAVHLIETRDPGSPALDRLRAAEAEVRDIVTDRRPAIVDELGLVAALEWLAERTEARPGGVVVELELVADETAGSARRPPIEAEQAAFRVARLAVDNALEHASVRDGIDAGRRPVAGSAGAQPTIRIRLAVESRRILLAVEDDGPGIEAARLRQALREGRRGLADMHATARSVGALLRVGPRRERGSQVVFDWAAETRG